MRLAVYVIAGVLGFAVGWVAFHELVVSFAPSAMHVPLPGGGHGSGNWWPSCDPHKWPHRCKGF